MAGYDGADATADHGGATSTTPPLRHLHRTPVEGSGKRDTTMHPHTRRSPLACRPASSSSNSRSSVAKSDHDYAIKS